VATDRRLWRNHLESSILRFETPEAQNIGELRAIDLQGTLVSRSQASVKLYGISKLIFEICEVRRVEVALSHRITRSESELLDQEKRCGKYLSTPGKVLKLFLDVRSEETWKKSVNSG
jgi:hypothetical protein